MKTIKLGIIGLGFIGQVHCRNSMKLPNAEVVAVADVSTRALDKAKELGVKKGFTDYEQLLNIPEIEAVIVALPTHLHLKCVKQAAEAGKDILLEKPIARNVGEAQEIISAAQKNSVKLMMGYPYRFNESFSLIKEKMTEGFFGDIVNANANLVTSGPFFHRIEGHTPVPVPEWWFNKELTGGGVLIDLGSHMIDLLRWLFGEVTDIKSHLGHRFNLDFEDSATCLCKFDSGTTAVMNVGWYSQEYSLKIDLFGSVRNISVQYDPSNSILTLIKALVTGRSKSNQLHLEELRYFLECVAKNELPLPSGLDGLRDLEAISLAYKNEIVFG